MEAHGPRIWKHEKPLKLNWESDTSTDAAPSPSRIFPSSISGVGKWQHRRTVEEKRRFREQRDRFRHEREASRPYHQFMYQVSTVRKRIAHKAGLATQDQPHDINSRAYNNIKLNWSQLGIWNEKWGILSGMSWRHEEPMDETDLKASTPILAAKVKGFQHFTLGEISPAPGGLFSSQPFGQPDMSPIVSTRLDAADSLVSPELSGVQDSKIRCASQSPKLGTSATIEPWHATSTVDDATLKTLHEGERKMHETVKAGTPRRKSRRIKEREASTLSDTSTAKSSKSSLKQQSTGKAKGRRKKKDPKQSAAKPQRNQKSQAGRKKRKADNI